MRISDWSSDVCSSDLIKTNRDGTLSSDDARLSAAVVQHPGRVHDMFVPGQTSSSPLLEVASAIGAIKTGSYEVTNVVAATAGTAVGSSVPTAFDSPVVIDASNKSFPATVDGRTPLHSAERRAGNKCR